MTNIFDITEDGIVLSNPYPLFSDLDLKAQEDHLVEDILQISFKHFKHTIIDIGWYGGDFDSSTGHFCIMIVKNTEWDFPVYKKTCKSVVELGRFLNEAILIVKQDV
ncbi:MAG: hypothetical protein DI539_17150 [Flavobacterium psychrophilum]|nr:MAG: hypothetical protein DI539_17150 [Flavobacterium psychrophilum]